MEPNNRKLKDLIKALDTTMGITTLSGVLSFINILLTWRFFPEVLESVGTIGLICFMFLFGATNGLMIAVKILKKKELSK